MSSTPNKALAETQSHPEVLKILGMDEHRPTIPSSLFLGDLSNWHQYSAESPMLFDIPWRPRNDISIKFLTEQLLSWLGSLEHPGTTSIRDTGYITISGGSGAGKTRTGWQLPTLIKSYLLANTKRKLGLFKFSAPKLDIMQTFCFSDYMYPFVPSSTNKQPPPENPSSTLAARQWLAWKLASLHVPKLPYDATIDFHQVLKNIRSVRVTPKDATLIIFFQVDEFQMNRGACTHLLRAIASWMKLDESESPFKATNTLLVPIFTGTWIGDLLSPTELININIALSGLDNHIDAHKLFCDVLKAVFPERVSTPPDEQNVYHKHILAMLGYIPNMIVRYARHFKLNPLDFRNFSEFETFWYGLDEVIHCSYNESSLSSFELDHILCLWYFSIPIPLDYKLNTDCTLIEASDSGLLFLKKQPNKERYTVTIPFILVAQWDDHFTGSSLLNPPNKLDKDGLSKCVLSIHLATYHMMGVQAKICQALGSQCAFGRECRLNKEGHLEVLTSLAEIYNNAIAAPQDSLDRPLWIDTSEFYPNLNVGSKASFLQFSRNLAPIFQYQDFECFKTVKNPSRKFAKYDELSSPHGDYKEDKRELVRTFGRLQK